MKEENNEMKPKQETTSAPISIGKYLSSNSSYWYWLIIILSCITTVLVFTIPENSIPIVYVRYVFGAFFLLFFPGYCLIKTLFPKSGIDNIERTALSIGMSMALVPLIGLLLSFTPWGIRTTPITISLLIITIILATTAVIRQYNTKTPDK